MAKQLRLEVKQTGERFAGLVIDETGEPVYLSEDDYGTAGEAFDDAKNWLNGNWKLLLAI